MIQDTNGTNIEVRSGKREDALAAARLWMESAKEHAAYDTIYRPSPEAEKMMCTFLSDLSSSSHAFLFVASITSESKDEIVGFVSGELREGSPTFRPKSWASVDDVYVTPKYRSLGIGLNLINKVREWAKQRGVSGVSLQVAAANERARSFYQRLEFREVSVYEVLELSPE
ncbi:MAG: GNAT family N-acetyltransferase [Rubrobacter sp.]